VLIDELKGQWNQVLDFLLEKDRIAWLAFFDARLVSLTENHLVINFMDSQKFGGQHDFTFARNPKHLALLLEAIKSVTGVEVEVSEE
jgi:citrate lyase alpha subunit